LSVQIKELEQNLQTPLFDRGGRTITLTSFGVDFRAAAYGRFYKAVDELQDMARASKDGLMGRLRIGIIPTIGPYLLPSIITKLTQMNPALDIHVRGKQ